MFDLLHVTLFLISNRNLSSTKQSNRQTMRKCPGLIDSLVRYLKDSVEAGKPDNKVPDWVEDDYAACQ